MIRYVVDIGLIDNVLCPPKNLKNKPRSFGDAGEPIISMKLSISNISPKVNYDQLQKLFGAYGLVLDLKLNWNSYGGRPSGSAVIEMPESQGQAAKDGLNGKALNH